MKIFEQFTRKLMWYTFWMTMMPSLAIIGIVLIIDWWESKQEPQPTNKIFEQQVLEISDLEADRFLRGVGE